MKTKSEVLDYAFNKVIGNPVTCHALLEMLIEDGVKISVDHKTMSHEDRKLVLKQIMILLNKKETETQS